MQFWSICSKMELKSCLNYHFLTCQIQSSCFIKPPSLQKNIPAIAIGLTDRAIGPASCTVVSQS
jgi:hypothetical protein